MRLGARDREEGGGAGLGGAGRPNTSGGPALREQYHRALKYLTAAESRALAALAEARSFKKGAVIVGIGPSRRALYLVTSGAACMVRSHLGQDTAIAHFGAGNLVGEFSYLLRSAGHTLIYAAEPVEARVISEGALSGWLAAEPARGLRFYQSLAAHVWQRRAADTHPAGPAACVAPAQPVLDN